MKRVIIGIGFMITGTIYFSAHRIMDTIYTVNSIIVGGGLSSFLFIGSIVLFFFGFVLCMISLFKRDGKKSKGNREEQ